MTLHHALFLATFLASACPIGAQSIETRGTIYGRILDPQGSAIVGATVSVTNIETNVSTKVTSNEAGYYQANLLVPGQYGVTAESAKAMGFKLPMGRLGRPDDIARVALFLASDQAAWVTGERISVSGGER